MEFLDTIVQVKNNWQPFKKWDIEQQKKEKQTIELRKKYPPTAQELKNAKQYGRTLIDVINTMDQHSIDKSEDTMLVFGNIMILAELGFIGLGAGLGSLLKKIPKIKNNNKLAKSMELIGLTVGAGISSILCSVIGAQIQKQASRIARFHTRENDLKDSRNFVIYDEKQMNKAMEIAKTLPEVEEKKKDLTINQSLNPIKNFAKAKVTTDELSKDYKVYEEWKNEYLKAEALKNEKFGKINPSAEEIGQAEKDRDLMLGTIKKVENYSLNYFMNMSLALSFAKTVIFASGVALSAGAMAFLGLLQNKNVLPKESAKLNAVKFALPVVVPATLMITLLGPFIKLGKDSARIGRYKAKQELLNNPEFFIAYSSEQRKTVDVKDVSNSENDGFFARLKQDVSTLKQFKKDYAEYHNYMKTTHKDELKLQEALKQVEISDNQQLEAVKLQKTAFYSFEKMDEKAQRYTDDTDAAVDSGRIIIASILATTGRIATIMLLGDKLAKYSNKNLSKLSYKDLFAASKHLKGKEIAMIMAPFVLPSFINITISIKGIQIKKDAGKIGVMTAMKDLENPKNFLNESV